MKNNQYDYELAIQRVIRSSRCNLIHYNWTYDDYNKYVINDIIYDEQKHLVSAFKEYLLWDESSDFLRRFYNYIESSNRIPGIAEYYNNYTVISPSYGPLMELKKILLKNIRRRIKLKERMNENGEEKPEYSPEKYSTILKTVDMESIESLHERSNEISLVSNEFMENKNISNISFDENLSNFSISLNSINRLKKRTDNNCSAINILSNDNSKLKCKSNKKKGQNKVKFEPKKTQPNKQLINSQKSFKNIIQNYLKKENKQNKSSSKQIFHKIKPYKINIKDTYNNVNRDKNKNSQPRFEDKIITPQLPSHTPLSFKTNLRSSIQTNLTSRNNIISPTTFLKVNLTKESVVDKSRKGFLTKDQTKVKLDNNNDYSSNKELVSSNLFKTIISNLVTPNKKLPNKCVKPPVTSKVNLTTKKEDHIFIKKPSNNILGINNTNNTTSFNNSKASSVYNINLNLNLNVNFNNSSKGSSSNTTLKNNNPLNTNTSQSKPKFNDINNVVNLKENKINIYESHIIKKINSPRREDCINKEFSSKTESNELPLTDRLKSPKESILKQSTDKPVHGHNTLESSNSKGKKLFLQKPEASSKEKKSNVGFINKILHVKNKDNGKKTQGQLKEKVLKSITPVCTNNSLNKLFKLNLDLKIFDTNKNSQEPKKTDKKEKHDETKKPISNQSKKTENLTSNQGIKIKNFEKIFDVKKYLSNNTNNNTNKGNNRFAENKQKSQIKLDKKK